MGIFIYLDISESVTKEEWKAVYEETLKLVDAFPLAEQREVSISGIDVSCFAPTTEREETYATLWNDAKVSVGWTACGDYTCLMERAEDFYLKRDLVEEKRFNENAGDAMLATIPAVIPHRWDDERFDDKQFKNSYRLWGAKTQGLPYHIYILAIACMIENRLGEKAFVDGNISYEQCQRAVELANEHLEKPIVLPDRCVAERFTFKSLMEDEPKERCRWLARQNRFIRLRDKDWRLIFADIFANEDSFKRYYPMVRMEIETDADYYMIVALVLNKDFYNYCIELGEKYKE